MRKKIAISIAIFAAIVLAGAGYAKAFTVMDLKVKPQMQQLDVDAVKKWHDARCAKFKEKLEEKIDSISEKSEQHKNSYGGLVSRFETFINRLEDKGYDTKQLETDLATLKEKVDKFKSDFQILAEQVESTQGKVCDDADAKIKTNLGETRVLVQKVRKDAQEIRSYYRNEIRSDIKDLKNQTPDTEELGD